jgi:hypothetical protein
VENPKPINPDNLTSSKSIILFDEYKACFDLDNIIPFQIILCTGEYNDKKFTDKYLRFWNLDKSINKPTNPTITQGISIELESIYQETKNKLNRRGRETLIESKLESAESDMSKFQYLNDISFNNNLDINDLETIEQSIKNYWLNFNFENNQIGKHQEKIINTWEESGCNDSGDEYDDTTYLTCSIDIKFGFFKI